MSASLQVFIGPYLKITKVLGTRNWDDGADDDIYNALFKIPGHDGILIPNKKIKDVFVCQFDETEESENFELSQEKIVEDVALFESAMYDYIRHISNNGFTVKVKYGVCAYQL